MKSDTLAVTKAALSHFSQGAINTYKLSPRFINTHRKPKPNATIRSIEPTAAPPGFSSVEEWIGSILVRGSLDARPGLRADFDEVLVDTESVCASWFGECFTGSASLRIAGTLDQEKVLLKRADIHLKPNASDSSQWLDDAVLSFSTDKAARILQFGTEAETHQTLVGSLITTSRAYLSRSIPFNRLPWHSWRGLSTFPFLETPWCPSFSALSNCRAMKDLAQGAGSFLSSTLALSCVWL